MTGYNAAFVLTTAERDALIAKDPACSEHILRCYRGQDIKRWSPAWAELWMIVMRSSGDHDWPWRGMEEAQAEATFASTFPSLHAHFKQHEEALRTRRDQGQCWWELRSCDHYDAFTHPKLLYTDITWRPEIAYSSEPVVFVNTVYMWPTDDLFLLGVMNSPLMWSYFWRHAQHGKDEALRLFTEFLVNVPVPDADVRTRHRVEVRVEEMTHIAAERARRVNELLAWLALELDVAKPGKKLAEPFLLTRDEFVSEVRTRVPKKQLHPSAVTRLREAYADLVQPLIAAETRMRALETEVADLVYEAFDLTAEEVGLLWRTAPPRMPIERPQPVRPLAVLA